MDPNATLTLIEPLSETMAGLMNFIKYLVGGIFGIYFISFVVMVFFNKKFRDRLRNIEKNIEEIKAKLGKLSDKKRK